MKPHLTLIGMPGSGKSTLGQQLATHLNQTFLDTDQLIEEIQQQPLQDIMNRLGRDKFLELETQTITKLSPEKPSIISTGGSAIFSPQGMKHLASISTIIYLDVPLSELKLRIKNFDSRGLFKSSEQTLDEIYHERLELYRSYANKNIKGKNITFQNILDLL